MSRQYHYSTAYHELLEGTGCGKLWKTPSGVSDAEFTGIDEKTQRSFAPNMSRGRVDSLANRLRRQTLHAACSACVGDYEDPERTTPSKEFPDEEYEGESEAATTTGVNSAKEKSGTQ